MRAEMAQNDEEEEDSSASLSMGELNRINA